MVEAVLFTKSPLRVWYRRTQTGFWCWPDRSAGPNGTLPRARASILKGTGKMLPRVSSQYRANSRGSMMIESTASNASLDGIELPGDLEHLFTHVGIHFAGAILTTLGVAIGKGAVLRTN